MAGVETRTTAPDEGELRLDRWFRRHFPQLTQGRLQKLLRTGQVRVDGKRAEASLRLRPGQAIRVPPLGDPATRPAAARRPVPAAEAEKLRRSVLHMDDLVIVIDKPAGLAVQGGTGTPKHLDAMLDVLTFDMKERPRLVHRLDRDTSGVLVLARTARAAALLADAFRQKTTRKIYWAIVAGRPKMAQGRIDAALAKRLGRQGERVMAVDEDDEDARRAITLYDTLDAAGPKAAWLALWPVTGRTHQLRAHCALIGTPILGDAKYSEEGAAVLGPAPARRLHLHARSIAVPHPSGGTLSVSAPLPADLRETWKLFGFDPERDDDPFEGRGTLSGIARPRLVLFDFDGTLVDSQHSIVQAFATACRDHAIDDVDPTAIRRSIGLPLAVAIAASVPEPHRHRAEALTESYKLAHRALAAGTPDHDKLFPGAAATLDTLRDAGAVLGIATGKGRRGLVNTLNKHRLFDHFTVLRTADDGPGKPDPFMVLSALDETGIDRADAIMVGDTVFDMAMAANAGIAAIGVGWGYHAADELAKAGAVGVVATFDALLVTLRARGFAA